MVDINAKNFELNIGGLRHQIWTLRLDENETIDLALNRNAWKHAVAKMKPKAGDTIQVRSHDDSQYWGLFVQGVGPNWLKATIVEQTRAESLPEIPETCPLTTKWNVGSRAYDVIRRDDKGVLQSGFKLKEDAVRWIVEHLRKMAA